MKFSSNNIKLQEFNKSFRGFSVIEVKTFLEKISDEMERLYTENDDLKKRLESAEDSLLSYKKMEKNLQDTLINAQESTSKTIEAAKKQNVLLIKEAELKASQLIEKAKEEAENIQVAIMKLKDEKKLLIARIKAIVETQSDLLTLAQQNDFVPTQEKQKVNDSSKINVDDIVEKLL